MDAITEKAVQALGFRLQVGPFGIPDVIHYIRSVAEMEVAVLFGTGGSVEVILCGTYRQYNNDIVAVSLPTVATLTKLKLLLAAIAKDE